MMRVMMVLASAGLVPGQQRHPEGQVRRPVAKMNFEAPLTWLVWMTSIVSVVLTYVLSALLIPEPRRQHRRCGGSCPRSSPAARSPARSSPSSSRCSPRCTPAHVREVVTSSREGGASLNILSGLVAGNFSAYWLGLTIMGLMAIAYYVSMMGLGALMLAPAVFAFGLVAFGFLGMGPVTIAVDSYGPVTDNAQSVYELSLIETIPGIEKEIEKALRLPGQLHRRQGAARGERRRRQHLQGHRQAGADRHRGGRRDDDDLLDHHGADPGPGRPDGDRQAVDPAPAVPARPDHRRRGDLLVHRRLDAGGDHRRLPRGGVHQGQHQARRRREGLGRGQQEGGRDLHRLRAEGDVQHLPRRCSSRPWPSPSSSRSSSSAI